MTTVQFVPWTDNRYFVNYIGEIYDTVSGRLPTGGKVNIVWNGVSESVDAGLLVALCHFKINIPFEERFSIEVGYKDGDSLNIVPDNLYYQFNRPVLSEYPGFYLIPYYTNFAISLDGQLINRKTSNIRKWWVKKPGERGIRGGYRVINIYTDRGTGGGASRHRLMALAFKRAPGDPARFVVNHKDGIGGNDSLDNLEWTTHSGNTQHAYDNGLQPNNVRAVLVKNQAGEITRYDSIAACCKTLNMTHSKLSHRLRNNPGKMYSDGVAVVYEDSEEWVDGMVKERETYAIAIKNVFTGDIAIVNNQHEASIVTKVDDGTIWFHVSNESRTPIDGMLFRRYSDDEDIEWPVYSRWQLELFKRRPKKPPFVWLVTDTVLGTQELMFAEELSAHMGKSLKQTRIIANKGVSNCGRYRYELIKP